MHCTYISNLYIIILYLYQYYKRVFSTNLFLKNHGISSRLFYINIIVYIINNHDNIMNYQTKWLFTYLLKLSLCYLMKIENNIMFNLIILVWYILILDCSYALVHSLLKFIE